jgi:single-strand DNA-binding protein
MADGMNRVTLLGHLGLDPELRISQSGVQVLHLRIATTESWFDKEKQAANERTEWHDVTLFGNRAEGLSRVLKKGDALLIEGSLRTSSFEKDGVRRYRTEVLAKEIYFTGKRKSDPTKPASAQPSGNGMAAVQKEADLPF